MKNGARTVRKRQNFFVALAFIAALLLTPPPKAYLQNNEANRHEDRLVEKDEGFKPPVEITAIKSKAGVIKPGMKFSSDEDWIQGLTISVRNKSEKPITHISLRILFPRPEGQQDLLDFVDSLNYGESPMPYEDGRVPLNPAKAIEPGESVELKLSDEDYSALKTLLKDSGFTSINRVKVGVKALGFSDGTLWMAGRTYTLDRDSPGKLIPVKKTSCDP